MAFNKPREVLDALIRAYYTDGDVEAALACVTDEVEWVGTERTDSVRGKADLKKLLEKDFARFVRPISVQLEEPLLQQPSPEVAVFTIVGRVRKLVIRGTICIIKTAQGWLVANGHSSVPNAEQEKKYLQNELDTEREKVKALLENVPGGIAIYRVKKDGRIPTDYISDGLAKICGYQNGEDIMKVMGADSRKMVLEEDYPIVAAACKLSIEKGLPTSVRYRIRGKDGRPVPITLDSIIMKNARLGPDDIAVFYAVQTLVSEEAIHKAEEDAAQLALLNTVPAGIGVFDIDEHGITQNYLNDTFYKLIDARREDRTQFQGPYSVSSTHPADQERLRSTIRQLADGADSAQLDYRVKGGRGDWVWLHLSAAVVQRSKGFVRAYAAFNECTESKRQQLQLLQNQKAVALAETEGRLSIWTYNIDKGVILQQSLEDKGGHMGYPTYIRNVPQCFVEGGNIHPEDIQKYLSIYNKMEAGEEKADVIFRLINQNTGKYDWVHMFYRRMENDEEGERMAVGFSLTVNIQQEATERYRVEQKLREQMYASAVIYMEYNLTGNKYVGKNNLSERYLDSRWECPTEQEYRENMSENVDARYLDAVTEKMYAGNLLKAFLNGESRVSCDYRSTNRPGRPSRWYRMTAMMVKRPDTGDVMAFVYVEDIEEEKSRLLAIESNVSDGLESVAIIRLSDGQGRLLQAHSSYIPKGIGNSFVYDDAFIKKARKAVIEGSAELGEKAALLSTVTEQLKKQEVYQYAITTKRAGEKPKRQLFRFRYLDDRKTSVVLSVSDITSVYQKEVKKKRQLEIALEELRKASHAKAEFYSRMSHDMRTPMNGILGMAALSEDETDSTKLKENIGKIKESGEYLLSLINDTLDLQRIESGKMKLEPTIVSTTDVVRNIIEMIGVTAKAKGVALKYSQGNTDLNWYIRADALRLKQIFLNLLSNAIKFTPPGGTVELEFKLLRREGMVSHDVVYVRDTGVGMSKEFLKTGIFKPFSQESNAVSATYAGSGLGLSIAKSLVELMGGHIEVESELGAGTTFAVYLDFERVSEEEAQKALQTEKRQSKNSTTQLKNKRILLAEDHPLNAEIAQRLLQKAGCEVTWAQNGREAVDRFAQLPAHSFDAILMDIRMPVMDGLTASRKIRALDKPDAATVPIIAMTANAYEEDVKASMEAGMNAHLGKPISPKTLYDTLARYCGPDAGEK